MNRGVATAGESAVPPNSALHTVGDPMTPGPRLRDGVSDGVGDMIGRPLPHGRGGAVVSGVRAPRSTVVGIVG